MELQVWESGSLTSTGIIAALTCEYQALDVSKLKIKISLTPQKFRDTKHSASQGKSDYPITVTEEKVKQTFSILASQI